MLPTIIFTPENYDGQKGCSWPPEETNMASKRSKEWGSLSKKEKVEDRHAGTENV